MVGTPPTVPSRSPRAHPDPDQRRTLAEYDAEKRTQGPNGTDPNPQGGMTNERAGMAQGDHE